MDEVMSIGDLLERDGRLVYTNKGSSMMPLLREDRDLMIIEKKGPERCKRLDAVLFRRTGTKCNDAYVLHRILRVNSDGTYWIVGDNCVTGETVKEKDILGVLTAVVRDGKTILVTDKRYLFYSHLWCDWYQGRFAFLKVKIFAARCLRGIKKLFRCHRRV